MPESNVLWERYRPISPSDVVGQQQAVNILLDTIGRGSAHSFLLSGPSGVGKTTLARVGAILLGAERMEIDAATHTGIDAMREVQDTCFYKPLAAERRAIIVDEAHRLSKQAWDSMLKIVEEPPSHVYWFFCTTEPTKLPDTIRNRCVDLRLRAIHVDDLADMLSYVAKTEQAPVTPDVVALCAREAAGSARKALVNLSMCYGLDREDARAVLREQVAPAPVAKLCKLLRDGGTWLQAMEILAIMPDEAESYRISISQYLSAVLRKAKTQQETIHLLNVMEAFAQPYHPGERQAPLMRSIGKVLFGRMKHAQEGRRQL